MFTTGSSDRIYNAYLPVTQNPAPTVIIVFLFCYYEQCKAYVQIKPIHFCTIYTQTLTRNAYRILVEKPEGKRPLGKPRRRWVDNIKKNHREIGWCGMDWIDLAQDRD
jgi:hypothetical protein